MNNDQEITWIAGLLEGEGSFGKSKKVYKGKEYNYPRVRIGMTDLDIIDRYKSIVKKLGFKSTNIYIAKRDGRKDVYLTTITNKDAIKFMKIILPFMGKRRTIKIKEIINETTI